MKKMILVLLIIIVVISYGAEKEKPEIKYGLSGGLGTNSFNSLHYLGIMPIKLEFKVYHKDIDMGLISCLFGKSVHETSLIYAFSGEKKYKDGLGWTVGKPGNVAHITSGKYSSIGFKSSWYFFERFKEDGFSTGIFMDFINIDQPSNNSGFGGFDIGVDVGCHMKLEENFILDCYIAPVYSQINRAKVNGETAKLNDVESDFKVNLGGQISYYF